MAKRVVEGNEVMFVGVKLTKEGFVMNHSDHLNKVLTIKAENIKLPKVGLVPFKLYFEEDLGIAKVYLEDGELKADLPFKKAAPMDYLFPTFTIDMQIPEGEETEVKTATLVEVSLCFELWDSRIDNLLKQIEEC